MQKLAILHYLPIEYYPPVTNLIDYIANEQTDNFESIKAFSCGNVKGRKKYHPSTYCDQLSSGSLECDGLVTTPIEILRSPFPTETNSPIVRLLKYLHYNLFTLISLITYRPNSLLYYESYSAWPVYIFSKYFNKKCRIFIHNHEYASKEWYATTMKQVRHFHQFEIKWLYPRACWISQTNKDRLKFFHQDHPDLKEEQLKIMPNYPPKYWHSLIESHNNLKTKYLHQKLNTRPIKIIYVGSLSFQSTYLKELCEWVLTQNGKIQFDVYAYNLYQDVKAYLKGLDSPYINYYEQGIEYNDQPEILSQYDVGLILYKAHNQNYTYNAPNKLFEYLACDIDVWYPGVLQGPKPYNTKITYPKVVPVDFENMEEFDWNYAINKEGLRNQASEYFCEEVYKKLLDELVKE